MATGTIPVCNKYIFEEINVGNGTLNAGEVVLLTTSVAKTGYKPVGIVGVRKTGAGNGYIMIATFQVDSTTEEATFVIGNIAAVARSYVLYSTVMYEKL